MTAARQDTTRSRRLLRIPEHVTEIVLLPVAYTNGTDFTRAPRRPAPSITYFDASAYTDRHPTIGRSRTGPA